MEYIPKNPLKYRILKATKQRGCSKTLYGFDIETYGRKNKFLCATIVDERNNVFIFTDKRELIKFFKTKRFWNSYIIATNLNFDFHGTFFGEPEADKFVLCYRGSKLIYARSNIDHKKLNQTKLEKKQTSITFIDTLNYAQMSVENIGKILNVPKIDKPSFLGKQPKNISEWEQMIAYNIRDSEISLKFIRFMFNSFEKLGATPKITIASTSMSLFKNKYLKAVYFGHDIEVMLEQFESYSGGRVEAIKRGLIKGYHLYDINSLYPSVMALNKFPDPNTLRIGYNDPTLIRRYEGISNVTITTPKYMKYPFLFKKTKDKLIFPLGQWRAWYTHIELRKCLSLGYKINKVHKTQYFKRTCRPFKEYVQDLYKIRNELKKDNNPMQLVVKLCLNSLYGKFGQKFLDKDNIVHKNIVTMEMIQRVKNITPIPDTDYYRIVEDKLPSSFMFPIWASYVCAYGRIALYDYIVKYNAIYFDTDSVITKQKIKESNELGGMKLEAVIVEGLIVRPKFYFYKTPDKFNSKIKGLHIKFKSLKESIKFLDNPISHGYKIVKFKEALRRKKTPNEFIDIKKEMTLEDTKRIWSKPFSYKELQSSESLKVVID